MYHKCSIKWKKKVDEKRILNTSYSNSESYVDMYVVWLKYTYLTVFVRIKTCNIWSVYYDIYIWLDHVIFIRYQIQQHSMSKSDTFFGNG